MIYKKVKFVRKQVSYDRGVTWQDTEPLEYCDPIVLGVYPSLEACEDTDCDLEKYVYELTEVSLEDLPKFCTETNFCNVDDKPDECVTWHFPSGIIKHVLFSDYTGRVTNGGYGTGYGYHDYYYDVYDEGIMDMVSVDIGDYYDYEGHGGYISGETGASINGQEVIFHGSDGCYCPPDAVWRCFTMDYCVTIDEFMPWVGNTIKVLWKTHYTREHCSEEWQFDDDFGIQFVCFGEKWEKSYDYSSLSWKWQQKVASADSAGTITWTDGEVYYEEIPHPNGATGIEYTTGGAYPISVNFNNSYYGKVDRFIVNYNATSTSGENKWVGSYSEYSSYNNEYRLNRIVADNVGEDSFAHYISHGQGWLVLGGDGGQYASPPVYLRNNSTMRIYRAGYIKHTDGSSHVLLPMMYNSEQVLVDITERKVIRPKDGRFSNDSTFYESF